MKYRSEENQPFLFEGGDDAPEAAADMEAPVGDKKDISDEEAKKLAIERNLKFMKMARDRAAQQHGMMDSEGEPDLTPDRINSSLEGPFKTELCCKFWLNGIIYGILVAICDIYRQSKEHCGIEVILWVELFFGILLAQTILTFFTYFFISCCNAKCVLGYYITISFFGILALFGWIIYGAVIYFSDDNDCQSSADNFGWLVFMVIIIFFTLSSLIIILLMLCLLSCLACCIGKEKSEQSQGYLDTLTKQFYDPEKFTHTDTCAICQVKFEKNEQVTPLPCNTKHYFHTNCITENIKSGNFNCPICRVPVDSGQAAPEGSAPDEDKPATEDVPPAGDAPPAGGDAPPAEGDPPAAE